MPEPVDRDSEEVDPTGIRDLLAGLPDPGPMPADLIARIEARLQEEQTLRGQGPVPAPGRTAASVTDLSVERGRRRPGRTLVWLGAAAAGLVATAVVVPQLVDGLGGTNSADTAAYYPTLGADADSDAGSEAGTDDESEPQPAADERADGPSVMSSDDTDADQAESADEETLAQGEASDLPLLPLDGVLVVLPDLGLVELESLTPTLLDAVEQEGLQDEDPRVGAEILTEDEAISCWRTLAETHSFDRYAAAPAQYVPPEGQRQGEDVVALLGVDDDGSARSWLMPQNCTVDPDAEPVGEGEPLD